MINVTVHDVTVLLGSNADDAPEQMARAYAWLGEHITVTEASGVYTSPPYGGVGSDYLNRVITGCFSGSIAEFEAMAKAREAFQGRERNTRIVAIDIDLISYDNTPVRPADMTRDYFLRGVKELQRV